MSVALYDTFIAGDNVSLCWKRLKGGVQWSIQPNSTDEAGQMREVDEQDRRGIELSDEHKEYTDKMEEVEK